MTHDEMNERVALRLRWTRKTYGNLGWFNQQGHVISLKEGLPHWSTDPGLAFEELWPRIQKVCGRINIYRTGLAEFITDATHPNHSHYWRFELDLPNRLLDAEAICKAFIALVPLEEKWQSMSSRRQ